MLLGICVIDGSEGLHRPTLHRPLSTPITGARCPEKRNLGCARDGIKIQVPMIAS